ncbi:hypothetical protein LBMAG43_00400 [Methylococcaceae bacterium]|nr:hypothetical protein LBMAG43_00400 [Methylococcaceae bacterium]
MSATKGLSARKGATGESAHAVFLIYIQDDGKVRRNFVEAKHTLEVFKMLCIGKDQPYEALCQLFDDQTHDGSDMAHYYDLVAKSVDAISEAFQEKEIIKLATGRGALLPVVSEQITNPTDFTLVTWFVIS